MAICLGLLREAIIRSQSITAAERSAEAALDVIQAAIQAQQRADLEALNVLAARHRALDQIPIIQDDAAFASTLTRTWFVNPAITGICKDYANPAGLAAALRERSACGGSLTNDSSDILVLEGGIAAVTRVPIWLEDGSVARLIRMTHIGSLTIQPPQGSAMAIALNGARVSTPGDPRLPSGIVDLALADPDPGSELTADLSAAGAVFVRRDVAPGVSGRVIASTESHVAELRRDNAPYAITGVALLLVIPVVILLAVKDVQGKLRSILDTTDEMIAGNYSQRVSPSPIRELDCLARSVNYLAERVQQQVSQLKAQAFRDALTGLPNRALFADRLGQAMSRRREDERTVGVLFVDIDNFKLVNDSLGHELGDDLLITVAQRIQSVIRPKDTVSRLGGDKFTVLLEDLREDRDAIRSARRIQERVREPIELAGRVLYCSASIGVAVGSPPDSTPDRLLQEADVAMYRAKERGKDQYVLFDEAMDRHCNDRLAVETELRLAVERRELEVHYQPIVELATGRVCQLEALVRWRRQDGSLVSPSEFIPMAEENGLIVPIGQFVLTEACRQVAEWRRRLPRAADISISVNLSARQLIHHPLVADVDLALCAARLDPSALRLEITESAMMSDTKLTTQRLGDLRDLGVRLAVDDFGTGYSSLAYIRKFPIDVVKIDRSFVARVATDPQDEAIVKAIISLGHALGLSATAEGVETPEQARRLLELGCPHAQGFLFSKPVIAAQVEALLAEPLPMPQPLWVSNRPAA
ncbi:MAG: EAL domain-containing protein [Chloroflexota bacterium]